MSATITTTYYSTTDAATMMTNFDTILQVAYAWDSVASDTYTATSSKYAYDGYGSGATNFAGNGSTVNRNTYTAGNTAIVLEYSSSYPANLSLKITANGYDSSRFLVWYSSYRQYVTTVTRSDGFCIMVGQIGTSTNTDRVRQPFYFGLAPTTNALTSTQSTAVFSLMPWDSQTVYVNGYSSNVYTQRNIILSQNATSAAESTTAYTYNHTETLTAHPVYGVGCDDVLDDYLFLERIPDALFSYVGKVQFNGTTYYRLGHILVPYD